MFPAQKRRVSYVWIDKDIWTIIITYSSGYRESTLRFNYMVDCHQYSKSLKDRRVRLECMNIFYKP